MKASERTIFERLLETAARVAGADLPGKYDDEEPPLRSELFSADQMEQHGRNLAVAHRLAPGRAPDRLLTRLDQNELVLIDVCDRVTAAVAANRRITPAAEWLLDNFYLIEEQIRTARRHLPKGYSRELPRLAQGPSAGLPRVYDLALEAISHGDGRVDAESLSRFVAAYQSVTSLKLGELWAFPIMLRLALIENLRRVGVRIASATIDRDRAAVWADQMLDVALNDPKSLILVIADMARSNPPMASPFVAELARRLQGQSAALALPLTWIEQRLSEAGFSIEQLVQSEAQEQAGVQVVDEQHRGQPSLPRVDGLARVRRGDERRRAQAARRPGRALRQDGFRDARSLPARRGGDRQGKPPDRSRRGAQGHPAGLRRDRRHRPPQRRRRSGGARRFLSRRQGAPAPRTRRRRCALPPRRSCAESGGGLRCRSTSEPSARSRSPPPRRCCCRLIATASSSLRSRRSESCCCSPPARWRWGW